MMAPHLAIGMEMDLTARDEQLNRIPPPAYRHAAPSAPWPWIDLRDKVDQRQLNTKSPPVPKDCDHKTCEGKCWREYPQSRFPNWTQSQVQKCKIADVVESVNPKKKCILYKLDVDKQGIFHDAQRMEMTDTINEAELDNQWELIKGDNQGENVRVRALFVENMTGPALRMLGGKYDIEPFFFSSSLNWIPSYFQEDKRTGVGDHITITLPFIQSLPLSLEPPRVPEKTQARRHHGHLISQKIDTQTPLRLQSNKKELVQDLLSVHLVRNIAGSTIISFHTNIGRYSTEAKYLHERIRFAGQSVYWQKMLERTDDPTFLMLIFVWHAMYAWDEALQDLYQHICHLETEVIRTAQMELTAELHIIRAHLLHFSSLLAGFQKIVQFILDTPNPALDMDQRRKAAHFLDRECKTLLGEIGRLDSERTMQEKRLKNVMDLVFSSVNILDSKTMQKMTEAAVKDSAAVSTDIKRESVCVCV
ncbi:hypothetical protein AX15_006201 [Amanita polypyramis BW_CC]|nr:hypothetical protein AX15_006201 [Amanita polypyramis BW_CC]